MLKTSEVQYYSGAYNSVMWIIPETLDEITEGGDPYQ